MSAQFQVSCVKCGVGLIRTWKRRRTSPAICRECRTGEAAIEEGAVKPNQNATMVQDNQDALPSDIHISQGADISFAETDEPRSFPAGGALQQTICKNIYDSQGIWHPVHSTSVAFNSFEPCCNEAPAMARDPLETICFAPLSLSVTDHGAGVVAEKLSPGGADKIEDCPQSWRDRAALLRSLHGCASLFQASQQDKNGIFNSKQRQYNEQTEKQTAEPSVFDFPRTTDTFAIKNTVPAHLLLTAIEVLKDKDEFQLTLLSCTEYSHISAIRRLIELCSELIEILPTPTKESYKTLLNDRLTTLGIFMFFNVEEPESSCA